MKKKKNLLFIERKHKKLILCVLTRAQLPNSVVIGLLWTKNSPFVFYYFIGDFLFFLLVCLIHSGMRMVFCTHCSKGNENDITKITIKNINETSILLLFFYFFAVKHCIKCNLFFLELGVGLKVEQNYLSVFFYVNTLW